jgi:biotin operon repressor
MRPHFQRGEGRNRDAPQREVIQNETLVDRVNRLKHRWLKRVMFDHNTSSSEKNFAYLAVDFLNCVTLDCWPSQKLIADKFGWSTKTVRRVVLGLERRGYLIARRNTHGSSRYAPVFVPEDEDISGGTPRQSCPSEPDKNVEESFLGIQINQSSPSAASRGAAASRYEGRQRGFYEAEIAKRLGNNGFEILGRLSEFDDDVVERLCRAQADCRLGERELLAARLAADQLPKRRSWN